MPSKKRRYRPDDSEPGTVYLICFARPIGNPDSRRGQARHYLGWCKDLERRLAQHRAGHGARILAYLLRAGVGWRCVRTWGGTRADEARLKDRHRHADLCPRCNPRAAAFERQEPAEPFHPTDAEPRSCGEVYSYG